MVRNMNLSQGSREQVNVDVDGRGRLQVNVPNRRKVRKNCRNTGTQGNFV